MRPHPFAYFYVTNFHWIGSLGQKVSILQCPSVVCPFIASVLLKLTYLKTFSGFVVQSFLLHFLKCVMGELAEEGLCLWLLVLVTSERWHAIRDMGHMTCDTLQVTCDIWQLIFFSFDFPTYRLNITWCTTTKNLRGGVSRPGQSQQPMTGSFISSMPLKYKTNFLIRIS